MQSIEDLTSTFPRAGRLEWIGIAARRGGPIEVVSEAALQPGTGIDGEHHATSGRSKRQVTLIQQEHLAVVAALLERDDVPLELLRRNLAVSGINVWALEEQTFRIGEVLLRGTGPCAPCSQMEKNLGPGGYNAMRGHGGITAEVLEGGMIRVGDIVSIETE
jgi:MOSC domain-containing protein YiiM